MNLIERVYALDFSTFRIREADSSSNVGTLADTVVAWVTIIAAAVAFFYLVYAGFLYMTAGGNPDQAKKGQQGIVNALIGLVIVALSYLIVRVVINTLGDTP